MQDENKDTTNSQNPSAPQPIQPTAAPVIPSPLEPVPPTNSVPPSPTPVEVETSQKPKREGGILSFVLTLLVAFVLVQIINMFLFQSYKVFGNSMYSTLHEGDRLIISKIGRTTAKLTGKKFTPERGEIIVFVDPQNRSIQLIKRVIGFPGERVVVKDEKITVYNKENPEGFNPDDAAYGKNLPPTSGDKDVVVPDGHLFVSGDNRIGSNSLDSRNELGTVPKEDIVGTLKVRIFPLNDARFF